MSLGCPVSWEHTYGYICTVRWYLCLTSWRTLKLSSRAQATWCIPTNTCYYLSFRFQPSWCLSLVLTRVSSMANNVEHFPCASLEKCLLRSFAHFRNWVIHLFIVELYAFSIYSRLKSIIRRIICKYCLPSYELLFHFLTGIVCRQKRLIPIKTNFSFSCFCFWCHIQKDFSEDWDLLLYFLLRV